MNRLELELIVGRHTLDEMPEDQHDLSGLLDGAVVRIKKMDRDGGADLTGRATHWVVTTTIRIEPLLNWMFDEMCNRIGAGTAEPRMAYEYVQLASLFDLEQVLIEDVHLSKALAYSVERTTALVQDAVDSAAKQLIKLEQDYRDLYQRIDRDLSPESA